jgi:hypothetical protein
LEPDVTLYKHDFAGATTLATRWQFGWWSDSSASLAAAQAAAVTWAGTFWGGFDVFTMDTVTLVEVTTREIDPADGIQLALDADTVSHAGTQTTLALPTDCCIVCSLRTNLANRRGRGRMYLPQMHSASTLSTVGRLAASAQSDIADALASAWSGYSGTGTPVVYSRVNRSTQAITEFDIGDLFDTQRGRQDRVAEDRDIRSMP